ncbi:thioredoxin domain-containing protein [Chondrinema litorale]|uniref:thioredoxin domain-containing protein n=1 Tax=Chondrinema litorale TaxID=2994555 RepID=UPI0025428358|nr:thioredoxin domain-containing protein [Chondrinema litorale]UZR93642.1 thioredoxin domain-containing protein [Chondrinema litorale]
MTEQENRVPNKLIKESSPYLLQHAYNPVDWYPWGKEALDKAINEDKPIIVSIGYSACHWCHVMERESFEHEEIAAIMNRDFVCIKVDREERPDVDQIYMDALQNMGVQGGWPLNMFLMPSAKPFYGGTYFPPQRWANTLLQIAAAFREQRAELDKSANGFADSLNRNLSETYRLGEAESEFKAENIKAAQAKLLAKADEKFGGETGAPKFPMPVLYDFFLSYSYFFKDEASTRHLNNTLSKMAYGGIYDQVGGGFARYSVDGEWFAPHFEKMLYDNAQLISLYSKAYQQNANSLYKEVVEESIEFVLRELKSEEGGFYSALDADSEGVEGKFYTWKYMDLVKLLGNDIELLEDFYSVKMDGNWEDEVNILYRKSSVEEFATKHGIDLSTAQSKIKHWKSILFEARKERVRPGLDDKILTSWNGLMITALADAYKAFSIEKYKQQAIDSLAFINANLKKDEYLFHNYKNNKATIRAYLEDYASIIQANLSLYDITFDESYLTEAVKLTTYSLDNFYDEEEQLFFFSDKQGEQLIARKKELFDSVIPSSNSIMAHNLFKLGHILENENLLDTAKNMLNKIAPLVESEPRYLANWAQLYLKFLEAPVEIAIIGKEHQQFSMQLREVFLPNAIINACEETSQLPLLQNRKAIDGKTTIYVCRNKSCQLPVFSIDDALQQI